MDLTDLHGILEQYRAFGPLPGILMAMLETFFPVLPLIPIVMANAMAFGLWEGFLYSWIGVGLGQSLLFLLVRLLSHRLRDRMLRKYKDSGRFLNWIEEKGFTSVFILCSFPFSPSTTVAVVGGLTTISIRSFLLATFAAKGVMVFILSYIGHDLPSWIQHPWKFGVVALVMVGLWYGGKWVENRGKVKYAEKAAL
ncbi:hypothetical protein CBW65_03730 [Tumebacillus avium]|uniref:TVP38/TMEM64 family membrane protein n=1 Tax=Tumebacillus avium TaxID=1903704 RepID=A0A1Y0IIE1_9BACL|nr:TVP38/TMEM64 family protein [Tumebacillus avium]ARU60271.1 hypothetical protein CBW65_03730 [Tumebacillus avium]